MSLFPTAHVPQRIDEFDGEHGFLSNFSPAVICFDGIWYPTVEHAYQAAKTLDFQQRWEISKLPTPGQTKRAGRRLDLRPDWERRVGDYPVKHLIMHELVLQKFARNPRLRQQLVDTGFATLVEGNYWHDQYWGDCTCAQHRDTPGQNQLGAILMQVRNRLR